MAKINPNAPVTYKILMNALEYVVDRLGEMMEEGFAETKKGFAEAKKERQRIELELKREINDLKVDTPTQKEVNGLDKRVTRLEAFHSH